MLVSKSEIHKFLGSFGKGISANFWGVPVRKCVMINPQIENPQIRKFPWCLSPQIAIPQIYKDNMFLIQIWFLYLRKNILDKDAM